jgi:hypothetical protein
MRRWARDMADAYLELRPERFVAGDDRQLVPSTEVA